MQLDLIDYLGCPACSGELKLTPKKQCEKEILDGTLECVACQRTFEIQDGIPSLLFPETLAASDLQSQSHHDRHADYNPRRWVLELGCWEFALFETRARRKLLRKLELRPHAWVLETGVGNGPNLPIMRKLAGGDVHFDGMDISFETLKVARRKMDTKSVHVELVQANGSYLPYKTGLYDAVLHMGAFNNYGDKKRAMDEMCRVAKPGGKIVICDEGLAPGMEKTWLGKRLLRMDPKQFDHQPPVELVPSNAQDLHVSWIWQDTHYVIEFRK